jgi:hypothetical protein
MQDIWSMHERQLIDKPAPAFFDHFANCVVKETAGIFFALHVAPTTNQAG